MIEDLRRLEKEIEMRMNNDMVIDSLNLVISNKDKIIRNDSLILNKQKEQIAYCNDELSAEIKKKTLFKVLSFLFGAATAILGFVVLIK